jgi:Tetratricopeptide repeat
MLHLVGGSLLFTATVAFAQTTPQQRLDHADVVAWQSDLDTLAVQLPRRHPDPFRVISREEFLASVRALRAQVPALSREQMVVRLMGLIARIGDAHTSLNPRFDPAMGFHTYPIELESFSDGLYVEAADSAHRALVGGRVMGIGHVSSDVAIRRAGTIISHENDLWVKAQAPGYLAMPEVLAGLGLVDDPNHAPFIVERSGRQDTVWLAPAGLVSHSIAAGRPTDDRSRWSRMNDSGPAPVALWLQHPGEIYWTQYLADSRTLYVSYRAIASNPEGESNGMFFHRVFATADSLRVDRLVLDLRDNSGGNGYYNRYLVRGIVARPAIDTAGRLFVIIGRRTFSAAQNLVNDLERWSAAIFVGEPTGNAPNFFGDHTPIELPHSHLHVMVSTLWWQEQDPRDHRAWVPPGIAAEMTAADYRNNVDPAMVAILGYAGRTTLAAVIDTALAGADTGRLARVVEAFRNRPENKYARIEESLTTVGYSLLHADRLEAAVRVFRLSAAMFPQSANAYDSLGEALEKSGLTDQAIVAYRRALQLFPQFPSSRAALLRLGIHDP